MENLGGPSVKPYQPGGVWSEATFGNKKYVADTGDALYRRSLYTFWRRIVGPTMFFDVANRLYPKPDGDLHGALWSDLDADGTLYLDAYPVTVEQMAGLLGQYKAANPNLPVVLKGDVETAYGKVQEVLAMLKKLDIAEIGLVTKRSPTL